MKITDLCCQVMSVCDSEGKAVRRNWVFVLVQTDQGITGVGEATTEHDELAVKAGG